MLRGEKTVELRRRPVRAPVGTTVWIYETVPAGRIRVVAELAAVDESAPDELWRRHQNCVGITRAAFRSYFAGSAVAFALVLRRLRPLPKSPRLTELRAELGEFVAPQFYRTLAQDSRELKLFRAYSEENEKMGDLNLQATKARSREG